MVRRLGVELPQILLMFGGVFAATCLVVAELRCLRQDRGDGPLPLGRPLTR